MQISPYREISPCEGVISGRINRRYVTPYVTTYVTVKYHFHWFMRCVSLWLYVSCMFLCRFVKTDISGEGGETGHHISGIRQTRGPPFQSQTSFTYLPLLQFSFHHLTSLSYPFIHFSAGEVAAAPSPYDVYREHCMHVSFPVRASPGQSPAHKIILVSLSQV